MNPKTIKSVFSKIAKNKTNLKNHKVDLSLVQDVENLIEPFEDAEMDASYLAYEYGDEIIDAFSDFQMKYNLDNYIVNGQATYVADYGQELLEALDKLKVSADELGLDPEELIPNFNDLYTRAQNAENLEGDAWRKYDEILNYVGYKRFWNG